MSDYDWLKVRPREAAHVPDVNYHVADHVATVTLSRPEHLNAINPVMDLELHKIWTEVNADPDIRVAIITGAGDRAFCAGGDLGGDELVGERIAFGGGLTGIGGPLLRLRKPLIAAVSGYALGGGCELAMCADLIIASEDAEFGVPEAQIGVIGESGVVHRLMRQLPYRVALTMILTGQRLSARRALELGFVTEVVEPAALRRRVAQWASRICEASPLAVQAAKDAALSGLDMPLTSALGRRYELIDAYALSGDSAEAIDAFRQKRRPQWQGR